MASHDLASDKIKEIKRYQISFGRVFPDSEKPIGICIATKAIAAFQVTLTALDTPYDRKTLLLTYLRKNANITHGQETSRYC